MIGEAASQASVVAQPGDLEQEGMAQAQSTRRDFLELMSVGAVTAAAVTATGCSGPTWESFVQQHYHRLTDEEKQAVFARLEAQVLASHGVEVDISDPAAQEGVEFGYALNLSLCTGCRRCEFACAEENNTSRDPQLHYIRVVELERGSLDLETSNHHYEGEVPRDDKIYMPISCQQCENPPCVSACPVQATWREDDGIVVIDYDWCIGCRYCMAACPYGARHFNFSETQIAPSDINPDQGYLSNRLRPIGVVEKCHFCLHRTRRGEDPACLEVCPVGARKFGNLLDPHSEVRRIVETKNIYVLKAELGTNPRFFYFFD